MPTDAAPAVPAATPSDLTPLVSLLRSVVDLKRLRSAGRDGSWATRAFARTWRHLAAGVGAGPLAHAVVADALVATRLADLDAATLAAHGLGGEPVRAVRRRAFDDAAAGVDASLRAALADALASPPALPLADAPPPFVDALARQPRAGVTAPGQPRLVLTPTESHADHSLAVAVMAALLAPVYGADVGTAFFVGAAHHLHNATLPDAGHAGDVLLGEHAATLVRAARARALAALPTAVRDDAEAALVHTTHVETPEAKAFHAADALDRVLEIAWHARTARFTLATALDDYDLVHDGFTHAFQQRVMEAAGIG